MLKVRLLYPEDKEKFVRICSEFDYEITLHRGHLEVDAKSLLGVMGLETKFECYVTINTDTTEVIKQFEEALSEYSYE